MFDEGFPLWAWIGFACALYFVLTRLLRQKFPKNFSARVVWVCDGDTIWVKPFLSRKRKIRLLGMDAPESEQRWGSESQQYLDSLVGGKRVQLHTITTDMYGRWVSRVEINGIDVSLAMIEAGLAWPYYSYFRNLSQDDRRSYAAAGKRAKAQRVGLWQDATPETPWDWRKRHRSWIDRLLWPLRKLWKRLFD